MRMKLYRLMVLLLALALLAPAAVFADEAPPSADGLLQDGRAGGTAVFHRVARDTWQSFVALTLPNGLPADNINAVTRERSGYTSPTNIGTYLWSTLAARDLRIITPWEARNRVAQTLATVATLERHAESGQFFNWYDPATGARLTVWPTNGNPVYPFLSSVDNGWLAAALIMVKNAMPELAPQAGAIVDAMDFGFYYNPQEGQLRGGYWTELPPNQVAVAAINSYNCNTGAVLGITAGFTCHHYGTLNTEPRIASYLGIDMGDVPPEHYYRMWRTFPPTCDWSWPEMQPVGEYREYLGVNVFEGAYPYRGMRIVPSWGGSMFEALMPNLLVPEAAWGPQSWGVNHPLYVRAQMEHGLYEAQYGFWGFSPANRPEGGYQEYGVDAIGMEPNGYASNNDRTYVDYGFGECRPPGVIPLPEAYTNGVVTPHASFLALEFAPVEVAANLAKLLASFDIYGWGGYYDSVNVDTGVVAKYYLALDQGMIMAALGNHLTGGQFRNYLACEVQDTIQPLLAAEQFSAGGELDALGGKRILEPQSPYAQNSTACKEGVKVYASGEYVWPLQ